MHTFSSVIVELTTYFIADHRIGNYDPFVLKVLDHHMTQGDVFNVPGIELSDLDAVADAEGLEDHKKDPADDIGEGLL
ncbi:MAG: hypothetical protein WDN75_21485 [Bacteroidota bacterium]